MKKWFFLGPASVVVNFEVFGKYVSVTYEKWIFLGPTSVFLFCGKFNAIIL